MTSPGICTVRPPSTECIGALRGKFTAAGSDLTTDHFPGLTTLNENVVLAYINAGSADVHVGLSRDGESWEVSNKGSGLQNYTPAVTTYLDDKGAETLAMLYSDKDGAQMHYSSSRDGYTCDRQPDVPGKCNRPVVATLGGLVQETQGQGTLVTAYSDEHGPQLWCHFTSRKDGTPDPTGSWGGGQRIDGQSTHNVGGLAWLPQADSGGLDGCLVLVYQSTDGLGAVATRSLDGNAWKDVTKFDLSPTPDGGYVPALAFHTGINKLLMVYQSAQKLHITFSVDGLFWEKAAKEM